MTLYYLNSGGKQPSKLHVEREIFRPKVLYLRFTDNTSEALETDMKGVISKVLVMEHFISFLSSIFIGWNFILIIILPRNSKYQLVIVRKSQYLRHNYNFQWFIHFHQ